MCGSKLRMTPMKSTPAGANAHVMMQVAHVCRQLTQPESAISIVGAFEDPCILRSEESGPRAEETGYRAAS
jgi:hypothetical protein